MNRADPQSICRLLETLRIPYRMVEHPAAGAMEDLVAVEERLGVRICKNLFLCNRQKTVFYLLLIPADKRFKTSVVSKLIGSSRLSFGEEDKLYELLGVSLPGKVAIKLDEAHQVNLLIDREVLALEEIGMHPLVNTASIAMKTEDLMKVYFPFTGHEPQILDIPGETEE